MHKDSVFDGIAKTAAEACRDALPEHARNIYGGGLSRPVPEYPGNILFADPHRLLEKFV